MCVCAWNKLVSSANSIGLRMFETFTISFIYMIKSNGPNMDPWGTPQVIFMYSDYVLLYNTYCALSLR